MMARPRPDSAQGGGTRQLRGMAVLPGHRGRGLGAVILQKVLRPGSTEEVIWCNARVRAAALYQQHGFVQVGARFELPGIGMHLRMWRLFD